MTVTEVSHQELEMNGWDGRDKPTDPKSGYFPLSPPKSTSGGARKRAQPGRALSTKANNLSLIPKAHMVDGENRLPEVVF